MLANFAQSYHSLLEFEVAPPFLDSVSRSSLDDHVDRVLLERLAEKEGPHILLTCGNLGCTVQQWLEEAEKLLIFCHINSSIVVENGEQNRKHELDGGTFKDQKVIVFVEEHHLV